MGFFELGEGFGVDHGKARLSGFGGEAARLSLDDGEYILLSGSTKGLTARKFAQILGKLHGGYKRNRGGHYLSSLSCRPWS